MMADVVITLKLNTREYDLIRSTIEDQITTLAYAPGYESFREKDTRKKRQAELSLLLSKMK